MNFWWPLMVLRKKIPGCQCSDLGLVLQHLYCPLAPRLVGLFPIPRPHQLCSSCSFSSFCPDPVPLDFCMIGSLFDSQLKCQFLRKNFCNHFLLSHSLACHFIWFAPCFCSVAESCPILCDPMDCSMPGFSVLHYLLEFPQTHQAGKSLHSLLKSSTPKQSTSSSKSWHHHDWNEGILKTLAGLS